MGVILPRKEKITGFSSTADDKTRQKPNGTSEQAFGTAVRNALKKAALLLSPGPGGRSSY
jgi:hypothetical protein